jgi:hypothetical protein
MTAYASIGLATSAAVPARADQFPANGHAAAWEQQQQGEPRWLFGGAAAPRDESPAAQPQHFAPTLSMQPHYSGHYVAAYPGQVKQEYEGDDGQPQHASEFAGKHMVHHAGQQQHGHGQHPQAVVKKELDKEDVDFLVDMLSAEDAQLDALDLNASSPMEIPGPMGSPLNHALPVLRRNQEGEAFPLAGQQQHELEHLQQRVFMTPRPRWASYPAASPPCPLIPLAQSGSNPFLYEQQQALLLQQEHARGVDEAQLTLKRMRSNNMLLKSAGSQRSVLATGAVMKRARSSDVAGASSDEDGDAVEVEAAQLGIHFVRRSSSEGDDDSDGEAGVPDQRERARTSSSASSSVKIKRPWTPLEERVTLHLVYYFCDKDLRTISALAQKCDVHRSTRAIDKKLKRIVFFDKWHNRSQEEIRAKIRHIVATQPLALPAEVQCMIDNAVREANAQNLPLLVEQS